MTYDELYNAIRERLNQLIPARLELRFGCEVRIDDIEEVSTIVGKEMVAKNSPYYSVVGNETNYIFRYFSFAEILGTPPTLQEILLAVDKVHGHYAIFHLRNDGVFGVLKQDDEHHDFRKRTEIHYNLTKSVKEQSTETLQAIYDLLV